LIVGDFDFLGNGVASEAVKIPDASESSGFGFLDPLELEYDFALGVEKDEEVADKLEVKDFNELAPDDRVHFGSIWVTLESDIGGFGGLGFVMDG
jgi:hypothetical protein